MRVGPRGLCRVCGEGQGSFGLRSPPSGGGTTTTAAATKLFSRSSQRNDLFLRSDKRSVASSSFSSSAPSFSRRFFLGDDSDQAREARLSSVAWSSSRPCHPQRRTLFGWGKPERDPIPVVTKEELLEKLRRKHEGKPGSDFVLLDVREPEELHHLGWIDTAHNVPCICFVFKPLSFSFFIEDEGGTDLCFSVGYRSSTPQGVATER
ncbi:hypothetical protein QOT17_008486 [Balamuthia mandrillaris]